MKLIACLLLACVTLPVVAQNAPKAKKPEKGDVKLTTQTVKTSEVLYKTTDYWAPEHERCIAWNDPDLAITWPVSAEPLVSPKDLAGTPFKTADCFP